jgi:predicted ATPase
MITSLKLKRFKNFREAKVVCGPLTLLMGTNASGKSNVRDAFRFLHGVGRGYKLAEIFGEKYQNGALQWRGIRGGTPEIAYWGAETFSLEVTFDDRNISTGQSRMIPRQYRYIIEVDPMSFDRPKVVKESLYCEQEMLFDTHAEQIDPYHLKIIIRQGGDYRRAHTSSLISDQPIVSQILNESKFSDRDDDAAKEVKRGIQAVLKEFQAMRFLSLSPAAMRNPAYPGQPLGDRGENLSAVLHDICEDQPRKQALTEWVRALTPMDVRDFDFEPDQVGRLLVYLVENDDHRTSAYSASDGTLRFLAIAAALLGSEASRFYFLEELENGIHPTRLHLLLDLIEQNVAGKQNQVIATTHSPQLLRLVSDQTLEHTILLYRLEDQPDGHICRLMDLPQQARHVLQNKDRARLYESGWFEDIVSFLAEEEE